MTTMRKCPVCQGTLWHYLNCSFGFGDEYVVLKERSYRQAQERQRVAGALCAAAEDDAERARSWARDCLAEERRMRDRVTHLYGAAKAHGATDDELRGPVLTEAQGPPR